MSELIFVEQKPMAGKEHLPQPGTTIGREGSDINIADPEVSRRHATIRSEGGAVAIEDLGSTNGTFVNGERITGTRVLAEGDEVRFGNTVWRLQAAAQKTAVAGTPATPAPPQVTAARQVPVEQPAEPVKPPSPPPPVPAGAAPAGQAAPGARGDVPAPDFQPSAIRRVVPPPGGPAAFQPAPPQRGRGSAATRLGATVAATAVVAATAAAVIAYYVVEPFSGSAGDPAAAIQGYSKALADGDGAAACDFLTPNAQDRLSGQTAAGSGCEKILDTVTTLLNREQKDALRNIEPRDVRIDGDTARATVPSIGPGSDTRVELERIDGSWKISDPGN